MGLLPMKIFTGFRKKSRVYLHRDEINMLFWAAEDVGSRTPGYTTRAPGNETGYIDYVGLRLWDGPNLVLKTEWDNKYEVVLSVRE